MASCKIITAPKTGERIQSRLYDDLQYFDRKNADELFNYSVSDEYVDKYGDWTDPEEGGFVFGIDENGEPNFERPFASSLNAFEKPKADLKQKLVSFIEGMGFSYNEVDEILSNGLQSVSGVTDFLVQTVNVVNGADPKTLAEEAAHVYVEWLEQSNSPLFNSLMRDVTKYEVYKQVTEQYGQEYEYNEHILRKESVGKILADVIINGKHSESTQTVNRIQSWWGRVKEWLKDKFGVTPNQLKDYLGIVDQITSGVITGTINKSDYKLYDINEPRIQTALRILQDNAKKVVATTNSNGFVEYTFDGKKIENTVESNLLKELKKNHEPQFYQAKEDEFLLNKKLNKIGTNDISNIVQRFVEKQNGNVVTPVTNNLQNNSQLHNALTKSVEDMLKTFGTDAMILTDVNLYNKQRNTSSTINLMVIDQQGNVHILDFRFLQNTKPTTEQKNLWNKEMLQNQALLETYGFNKFGKLRVIPVETQINSAGQPVGINLNGQSLLKSSIPARNETTNSSELNSLLKKMNDDFDKLSKLGSNSEYNRIERNILLNKINKSIQQVQLYQDLTEFYFLARQRINKISKDLANPNFDPKKHLKSILTELSYYGSMSNLKQYDIDDNGKQLHRIAQLIRESLDLKSIADQKLKDHFANRGVDLDNDLLHPSSTADMLATLSVHKNKIFQLFNKLKSDAEDKIDNEQSKFNNKISKLLERVKIEENSDNVFDRILSKTNGKYDGNLIRQYKEDYWNTLKTANTSWIQSNTEFKPNAQILFNDSLAKYTAEKMQYAHTPAQIQRVQNDVIEYRKKFDFWDNQYKDSAYKYYQQNPNTKYLLPKNNWITDEYKYITNNPNTAISELYHEFQRVLEEARKYSPNYISGRFIPSVQKSFVNKLLDGGFKGMKDNYMDYYTDENSFRTSDDIYRIPLKYTFDLKADKSLDLGMVFSLFNHSVLQNKYLNEIEDESLLMENALLESKYYDSSWRGGSKKDVNGKTIELDSSSNEAKTTIKHLRQHINKTIYQVTNESKDFNVKGLSGTRLVDSAINFFSLSKLGLNVFTGMSNFIGGEAMLYSMAGKTKHFDKNNVIRAQSLIITRNANTHAAIDFFDILTSDTNHKKARKLSMSNVEKHASLDKMYYLMERGEWMIQNSALIAFLDANTIDPTDSSIRRKQDGEQSLLELTGTDSNGNIEIKGLTDEGFNLIRKRSRGFSAEIMGSLSEREVLLASQHLLGRAMLQFKRWILPMGRARFGNLTYNTNIDEFEEGKFRRFFSDVLQGNLARNLSDITLAVFTKPNQSLSDKIASIYQNHIETNPEFASMISLDEYQELYIRNLRSTIFDFVAIGSLITLIAGINDDDDETKMTKKMLNKALTELTFWVDPNSFTKLASNNVIPVIDLATTAVNLSKEIITLDVEGAGKQGKRLVPLWRQFEEAEDLFMEIID